MVLREGYSLFFKRKAKCECAYPDWVKITPILVIHSPQIREYVEIKYGDWVKENAGKYMCGNCRKITSRVPDKYYVVTLGVAIRTFFGPEALREFWNTDTDLAKRISRIMKRPTKKPQKIRSFNCEYLTSCVVYTPDDLRTIADKLDEDKIMTIEILLNSVDDNPYDNTYDYIDSEIVKMETEEEALLRYSKELKKYNKFKEREKALKESKKKYLIKEAEKLGLKVIEE